MWRLCICFMCCGCSTAFEHIPLKRMPQQVESSGLVFVTIFHESNACCLRHPHNGFAGLRGF